MNYDFIWLVSTYIGRNIKISSMRYTVKYTLIWLQINICKFFLDILNKALMFDSSTLTCKQCPQIETMYKKSQKIEMLWPPLGQVGIELDWIFRFCQISIGPGTWNLKKKLNTRSNLTLPFQPPVKMKLIHKVSLI